MTSWTRLIAIAALPRSGTTVTAALLGAHSRVHPVFEPWNGHRERIDPAAPMPWPDFLTTFAADAPADRDVLLVKETSTLDPFLDRIDELLRTAPAGVARELVVLVRNPFHIFLSLVQARRDWWGAPETQADSDTFVRWVRRSRRNLRRLGDLARDHDALIVPYEKLTAKPQAPRFLSRTLGLRFEDEQFAFDRTVDPKTIRGDIGLSKAPRPLSDASVDRREAEFEAIRPALESLAEFRWAVRQRRAVRQLPGIFRYSDHVDKAVAAFETA
ncbi:hypothetical protein [Sphingomonas sp.]|uniref:hypothetical protein n=1 Tax=Sphingomonas sp. TaxID=28214 RepID=UPI0035C7ED2D